MTPERLNELRAEANFHMVDPNDVCELIEEIDRIAKERDRYKNFFKLALTMLTHDTLNDIYKAAGMASGTVYTE